MSMNQDACSDPHIDSSKHSRRTVLFSYPRTASNLFVRILNLNLENQPSIHPCKDAGYFFRPAFSQALRLGLAEKDLAQWTSEERRSIKEAYEVCFEALQTHIRNAEADSKSIFVKEHVVFVAEPASVAQYVTVGDTGFRPPLRALLSDDKDVWVDESSGVASNETVLPEPFLQTLRPVFLIRHPALAFPSDYRTMLQNHGGKPESISQGERSPFMTLRWSRRLYEWYAEQWNRSSSASEAKDSPPWPIVLDADDILTDRSVVARFCELIGLDPTACRYQWGIESEEQVAQMHPVARRMLSTLLSSTGIVEGKTAFGLDLDDKARAWKREFGEEQGAKLETWVRHAMLDYEALYFVRLRPQPL